MNKNWPRQKRFCPKNGFKIISILWLGFCQLLMSMLCVTKTIFPWVRFFSFKLTWLTWIWLRIWVLSQDETIITVVWPLCQTEQNHKIIQFVLCRITIFCHQLTQNTMTEFVRYSKIYTNCSEIHNLRKSDKSIVIFWVNWWQKQLFPLKRQLFSPKTNLSQYSFLYSLA